jgi:hypothetical protein
LLGGVREHLDESPQVARRAFNIEAALEDAVRLRQRTIAG